MPPDPADQASRLASRLPLLLSDSADDSDEGDVVIHHGDCVEVMASLPECSVDAVVCDPPYGLEFMGKEWDAFKAPGSYIRARSARDVALYAAGTGIGYDRRDKPESYVAGRPFQAWHQAWATEALRVLKPGGHLVAFGGTRTYHRLACAVEDAGFEIRDSLVWLYGQGFPKSMDVSKAIDKAAGAEREVIGEHHRHGGGRPESGSMSGPLGTDSVLPLTAPATPDAQRWQGWGTALKPAMEPIVLARKPLSERTVAANVLRWGTGAINVDGCRIGTSKRTPGSPSGGERPLYGTGWRGQPATASGMDASIGRWPPNVCMDESAAVLLDEQSGESVSRAAAADYTRTGVQEPVSVIANVKTGAHFGDTGGASRFFYVAKASTAERSRGLTLPPRFAPTMGNGIGGKEHDPETATPKRNTHPTVKPIALMRWLIRLVTPPGGTVLDPFLGSGTTALAAIAEGMEWIGIEREAEYVAIAEQRIAAPSVTQLLF